MKVDRPFKEVPQAHAGPCPLCDNPATSLFLSLEQVPVHIGVLWNSREDALACPKGRIDLRYCRRCGFVFNTSFAPKLMEYAGGYDNALDFSPLFREYSRSLASDLIERHDLHGRDIIEIGSGKGDFLRLICDLGGNRGMGFDPSYEPPAEPIESSAEVTFVKDIYSEKYRDYPADLILCRQVFEHIPDPRDFLSGLRNIVGDRGTPLFFEVPDLRNILEQLSIWGIIYEHCSYFARESLHSVFARCGFEVEETPVLFEGLFVGAHVKPVVESRVPELDLSELDNFIDSFSKTFHSMLADWRKRFSAMGKNGQKAVVWGAGARGTSFVNLLDTNQHVEYLVDINPRKEGKFLAGTGQEIVSPDRLRDIRPDVVIVMNPIYIDEIRKMTRDLGVTPELVSA